MTKHQKFKLYDSRYGEISNDIQERLKYLFNSKSPDKIKSKVDYLVKDFKKIKKKKLSFIWYVEPHPSRRPRARFDQGYAHIYVPDAATTKQAFQKFWNESHPNFTPIDTPMIFTIRAYTKTPSTFSKVDTILAELGIISPWGNVFDVDNVFKAATDCAIGSLIKDDSLIHEIHSAKFYSIKPRIEYEITYYDRFPRGFNSLKK